MRRIVFLFVLLLGLGNVYSQKKQIPDDKGIHQGKLPNGMSYYLCKTTTEVSRADFYLVTKIGSLMEDEDQNGLAHFLEHMAFNGSRLFPGNTLVSCLERQGLKFGTNVNAYTSFAETVYHMNGVLLDNPQVLDTCLMVLAEWSDGLSLRDEDIEAERGVIAEEWRARRTSDARIGSQVTPVLFNGTKYAKHDIIGSLDVILHFPPDRLRDFYRDWHRPDLQAVIVVGDFNEKQVERKLQQYLGGLRAEENGREHFTVDIPDQEEPLYVAAHDDEQKYGMASLVYRHRVPTGEAIGYEQYKEMYIVNLYNKIVAERLSKSGGSGENSLKLQIAYENFLPGFANYSIMATSRRGKELEAIREAYLVHENIRKNGFSEDEFSRAKTDLVLSRQAKHNSPRSNGEYFMACKANFLYGNPMPDENYLFKMFNRAIKEISVNDLRAKASEWVNTPNLGIVVTGQTRDLESFPTKEQVLEVINNTKYVTEESRELKNNAKELFSLKVTPGKVVSTRKIDELGAEEWVLSNGAKILYKYFNKFKRQVAFSAESDGGMSLYAPEDLPSAGMVNGIILHGLGDLDADGMKNYLSGKSVTLGVELSELSEELQGGADIKDFETLMQMVHLFFVQPRFDKNVFDMTVAYNMTRAREESGNVQKALQFTIDKILSGNSPRILVSDEGYFRKMDFDTFKRIFLERFGNAGDFTFYIVGDIGRNEAIKMVEKYIASLPAHEGRETFVSHEAKLPVGRTLYELEAPMVQKRGINILRYEKSSPFSEKSSYLATIFSDVLRLRLRELLREREGGTYDVEVNCNVQRLPVEKIGLSVQFQCAPERQDSLHAMVIKEVQAMVQGGIRKSDFLKIVVAYQKMMAQQDESLESWLYCLRQYSRFGENANDSKAKLNLLKEMKVEDVNAWAKSYFSDVILTDVVIRSK